MPLTIKPPRRPSTSVHSFTDPATPLALDTTVGGRGGSPEAPPASPLTPVLKATRTASDTNVNIPSAPAASVSQSISGIPFQATPQRNTDDAIRPATQFIDRPPSLPFSREDSTDAIALRAAISSLQFQRGRAQQDLRTLEEIKKQAIKRPEEFSQYLVDTASRQAAGKGQGAKWVPPPDNDYSESDDDDDAVGGAEDGDGDREAGKKPTHLNAREVPDSQQPSFSSTLGSQPRPSQEQKSKPSGFPTIPGHQNVVRCPPIEWAKYHIHGESLDRLHSEQQARPGVGTSHGSESVIAAPYNPFVDVLEDQPTQNSNERKDSGASAAENSAQRRRSSKAFLAAK